MYCPACGSAVDKNAESCPECGKSFEQLNFEQSSNEDRASLPPPPPLTPPPSFTTPPPYRPQGMPGPYRAADGFDFRRFLTFEVMVTPVIIKVLYIIGSVIIAVTALIAMVAAMSNGSFLGFFSSVLGGLIGLVAYRVWLEILILLFNIYKELKEINKKSNH